MKQRILAVDDEDNIIELLKFNLNNHGYDVDGAPSAEQCLKVLGEKSYDLIILDIMLPGMDGLEACKRIKGNPDTSSIPIIMLTAKSEEIDKVLGLEIGADDYIVKPFSVRELVARVKALLRRTAAYSEAAEGVIESNSIKLDTLTYQAYIGGRKLQLTLKEFDLLRALISNKGKVMDREKLLDKVWGYEYFGETRTVDVHIRHLRQKLEDNGTLIETVRGIGYMFKGED